MSIGELIAYIILGIISLVVLFIVEVPTILLALFLDWSMPHNTVSLLPKIFYYAFLLLLVNMASSIFIPPIFFWLFRVRPKEGEYDLTPLNKEVFKWYLSLSLYKISMLFGRINHITKALVVKLFGGNVSFRVYLQGHVTEPYFVDIGDYTVVGDKAKIFTHIADKPGKIIFRRVKIGRYCLIGYGALIMPGTQIGDYAIIGAYAIIPKNSMIDSGVWVGAPAKKIKDVDPKELEIKKSKRSSPELYERLVRLLNIRSLLR